MLCAFSCFGGALMAIKLRIPDAWAGRVHSAWVRAQLQAFFQRPYALPPDPGAGSARVSLSISPRALKVLEGVTGDSASAGLRRLIAAQPALPSAPTMPVFPRSRPALALPLAGVDREPMRYRAPQWGSTYADHGAALPVSVAAADSVLMSVWMDDLRWIVPKEWVILAGLALALWFLFRQREAEPALPVAPAPELPRFSPWVPVLVSVGGDV